jgi:hypothetical protein
MRYPRKSIDENLYSYETTDDLLNRLKALNEHIEYLSQIIKNGYHPLDLLDTDGVRKLLKISKRTIQMWRDEGILPHSVIGGKFLYQKKDILKMLEQNRINKKESI